MIGDESPGWVLDSEPTELSLGALRGAVLDMHREVRKVRYSTSKAAPADRRAEELQRLEELVPTRALRA